MKTYSLKDELPEDISSTSDEPEDESDVKEDVDDEEEDDAA